jgi:Raf kinase inhibitor-like YbhB/YbcL family protein
MKLTSSAFGEGQGIPAHYTCDGSDRSPPLAWTNVPAECQSLAVFCDDPDAPAGTWHHWAAYDIPTSLTGLTEDLPKMEKSGPVRQAMNDFRRIGYGGPCPPHGHGPHHYRFRLVALSAEHLELSSKPTCKEVARAAAPHIIAEVTLTGVYER